MIIWWLSLVSKQIQQPTNGLMLLITQKKNNHKIIGINAEKAFDTIWLTFKVTFNNRGELPVSFNFSKTLKVWSLNSEKLGGQE